MIKINLLPIREIKRRNKAKRELGTFLFGLALLVAALGLIALYQVGQAKAREAELTRLQADKQKYNAILAQIKKIESDKAVLENQIKVIDQLKASSSVTVHVLDDIARLTPEKRIWLTDVQQNASDLKISGMALDNRTVAKFMEDLRQSSYIQNVNLTDSSLKEFAGRNLKSFSLTCMVGAPGEEAPAENQ